jgi:pyridine nucleotide-disulfide oxidoreductase family protein
MSKRILLLGGGHAHVHVLQTQVRQPIPGADVTLVSPYARQLYSGMVPGLVAGHYRIEQCAIALPALAQAAQVRLVQSSAVAVDSSAKTVQLADGQMLAYDLLSIDTGAVMDRGGIPGAREHALYVRPIEHFVQLLDGVWELAARRALDVVVVGAGASGVELALAIEHRLCGRGEELARVALVTGGPEPLAAYPARVQQLALRALARRRIAVFRDTCSAIEANAVVLGGGARLACDAPVLATGAQAPSWLRGSGLALNEAGFVITGPTLQSGSHANVFAVGDVATRVDAPHPKSGVYAVRAGPPLAENLRRLAGGGVLLPHAPQQRTLNLVSCGAKRAILSWGGLTLQGRWAWWLKDRIDRAFVARYSLPEPVATTVTRSA